MCEAATGNEVQVRIKGRPKRTQTLDLASGVITEDNGDEFSAPELTEFLTELFAETGIDDIEAWANENTPA